ncbi:MAG: peptidylprolyl isomerase [Deltaproteobacteria bacterium]|nr:peptidylprolyl isomerase [Deltaproteobacteria bacterium]
MKTSLKIVGFVTALLLGAFLLAQAQAETQAAPSPAKTPPAKAAPAAKAPAPDKNVVARIGNRVITIADFNKIMGFYEPEQRKMIEKNPQAKPTLLWQTVQGIVLADLARQKGFDKKPDIKGQMELITNNFLAFQYLQREVISKVTVSEKEAKAYYDKNTDLFKSPEQVKARHILIQVPKDVSEEDKKKLKEKTEGLLKQIQGGEDFAKLAEANSDDPGTKTKGGDLGFFSKGAMVPAFEQAAFALKPGELSGIVESDFGFHIIKVDEKKDAVVESYESIKDKVKKQALREKQETRVTEFVEKALKDAKVMINPEALMETK